MAFHFSANQFEDRFQAHGLNNWEYPRFAPPRPRKHLKKATPIVDKNGHLLPTARRGGNSFGHFRGTYELPLKITRSFCGYYDACLSNRYKYRDFPRDLCNCDLLNRRALACNDRMTLGLAGDPYWERPKCLTKCEGVQLIIDLHQKSLGCKRAACDVPMCRTICMETKYPKLPEIPSIELELKRKRTITAFARTRKIVLEEHSISDAESKQ